MVKLFVAFTAEGAPRAWFRSASLAGHMNMYPSADQLHNIYAQIATALSPSVRTPCCYPRVPHVVPSLAETSVGSGNESPPMADGVLAQGGQFSRGSRRSHHGQARYVD